MNARLTSLAFAAACALLVAPIATAAPCAGFTDVEDSSEFCRNVEWIRNRGVTLGCDLGEYCPASPVSRLQMAAFMNRLGTALTPVVVRVEAVSGALDLDLAPVVCQTGAQEIAGFPRRALLDGSLSGRANTGTDIDIRVVWSGDGGATWVGVSDVRSATFIAATQWSFASDIGSLDLAVGTTARFGLQVTRNGAGSVDLVDSRCQLRVAIGSRDGTSPPY